MAPGSRTGCKTRRHCQGWLQPVLDTIRYVVHETRGWVELTCLLIPGANGSEAELRAWTRDQFRDGTVSATSKMKDFLVHPFSNLPASIQELRMRVDSALYHKESLAWLDELGIGFAFTVDMAPALATVIAGMHQGCRQPHRAPKAPPAITEERERVAVIDYVSD